MGRHRLSKRRIATRAAPLRKSRRHDCSAGMQDTPVLGGAQGTTAASTEAPPHTASPSPASSSAESPLHTPPPSRRRTRLSDPSRNLAESLVEPGSNEDVAHDISPATTSSAESAPLVASAPSSPVTSPVESPPQPLSSSSEGEQHSTAPLEGELPTNLTGARKRKAHRVVKRETSSEGAQVAEVERGSSSTEEVLTCPVCEAVYSSQSEFTSHIRAHNEASSSLATPPASNNNNKVFSCSICGKLLSSSSSLDRHMLVHSGERPFKCRICSVAFTTNGNMHRHMRTHNNNTSSVNNNHQLMDSDGASSDGASERTVSRKRRSNGDLSVPSPKKRNEEGSVSPAVAAVPPESCLSCQRCDKCFMTFNSERELSLHRYAAHAPHDDEPIIEEPKVSSGPAQVGFKDLNFVDFSTDKFPLIARAFCERSIHKASSVIHRFQCEECGRAFPCGSALHIHVTSAHAETSPRDLTCPRRKLHYEEQKEDFFAGLDLQTKSPSSSPPPTTTPSSIKVRALSELATPRREDARESHTEEQPRDLADIPSILNVANRGALDLAKSPNSSSDEGLRQMKLRGEFPCRLCSAIFPNLRALKGHNRVHLSTGPPYYCNMCVYSSGDKATLVRHLRTHNGERPFECRLCHYAFTTKANCERHLRNRHNKTSRDDVRRCIACHLGEDTASERPYECAICERSFPSRSAALSHAAREHPTSTASDLVRLGADPEEVEDEAELLMSPGSSPRPQERSCSPSSEDETPRAPSPLDLSMDALDLSKKPCAPVIVSNTPPQEAPQDLTKPREAHAPILPPHPMSHLAHPFLSHHPGLPNPPPPSAFFPNPLSMYLGSPFQRPPFPFYMPLFGSSPSPAATPPPPPPAVPAASALDEVKEQLQKELIRGLQLTSGGSLVMDALRKPPPEPPRHSPPPQPTPEIRPDPPVKMVIKNGVLMPKQKQRRYRTERPFACEHCSARFTLRSNMERHVKQQHPQFWSQRPRGGRRSAPARPAPSPLPTAQPEITLLAETRISDEVKLALTQQLKHKLDETHARLAEDAAVEGDGEDEEDEPELVIDEAPPRRSPRDDADLASVSRLLVNASAQNFQHFFPGHEEDDEEEEGFMEGDELDEGMLDCEDGSSSEGGPLTSGDEGRVTTLSPGKKKSAYSSAPNRVSCPYCHRKFPWSSSLRRHILTHTGQKPFKCAHCPLLFTTKSNCDRHLLRKHSKKSASPPTSAPTTPIPPPPPPPPSEESYLMRNVPERPFKCNLCPSSTFSTERNLRKHVSSKHAGKRPSTSPPTPTTSTSTTTPPSSGKEAQSAADSGRGASPDPLPPSSDSTSPEQPAPGLTCYKCSQTFSSEARLTAHLESHSDLPFKCHLCENSYAERQEALEHIRAAHATEFELLVSKGALDSNAEDCTVNAPPTTLNNNNNNNEAGDDTLETLRGKFPDYANRKVMCAFCMRRFWSAEDLRRHMRTHTGERPFTCDICWRKFTLKHSMLRHRKKHATHAPLAPSDQASDDDAHSVESGASAREGLRRWAEHAGLAMYSGTAARLASFGRSEPAEDDLIGNLLGIKDRAMIDHMLSKSADDAAKLLGVSSQR